MTTPLFVFVWGAKKFFDLFNVRTARIGNHVFVQPRDRLCPVDYRYINTALSDLSPKKEEVYLHLNCFGGIITTDVIEILRTLQTHPNITATTFGADSVPAYIFLSANYRIIRRGGKLGLHGPIVRSFVGVFDKNAEGRLLLSVEDSSWLLQWQEVFAATLNGHTSMSEDMIQHILSGHRSISSDELIQLEAVEQVV